MKREGEIRISSGCAISGIFCRDGRRISGEAIRKSIAVMHNRSNGLGGGFAAYGIYPQYRDHFALHIFYDSQEAREETERFRRMYYCGGLTKEVSDTEVEFWAQALTEGDVSAAELGQSFFFSPAEMENSSFTDDDFIRADDPLFYNSSHNSSRHISCSDKSKFHYSSLL